MEFIDRLKVGETFTIQKIWQDVLMMSARDVLDKHLEQDISTILRNCDCVEKVGKKRVQGTDIKRMVYEKINPILPPID